VDDRALLRDLQAALQSTEGQGAEAQAGAISAVLAQHGATVADIYRLRGRATTRRRNELSSLRLHLDGLIAQREVATATAEAVDRFLRQGSE